VVPTLESIDAARRQIAICAHDSSAALIWTIADRRWLSDRDLHTDDERDRERQLGPRQYSHWARTTDGGITSRRPRGANKQAAA